MVIKKWSIFVVITILLGSVSFYKYHLYTKTKEAWLAERKIQNNKANIKRQLDNSYAKDNAIIKQDVATIETALIPLDINEHWLGKIGHFSSEGGSITAIGSNLLVMDRLGKFYIFNNGRLVDLNFRAIGNNIEQFILDSGRELNGNLMRAHSVAYDKSTNRLYVAYTKYINPEKNTFVISSTLIDEVSLRQIGHWESFYESNVFDSSIGSHAGGGKILIARNKLYFAIGNSEEVLIESSQNSQSESGKVFEADLLTKVVTLIASGLRNPQGMTLTKDGYLLCVDQGPQGGDEINLIENGKNFGWPYETYGTRYGTYDYFWPIAKRKYANKTLKFTKPIFAFVPSIGISSILFVNGFNKRWVGDLIVGSLKGRSLYRIKYEDNRVIYSEPIWIGHRIRDLAEIGNNLYILTDDSILMSVTTNETLLKLNSKNSGLYLDPALAKCLVCHSVQSTNPTSMAPSLANILNRKIASDRFDKYSKGLKEKQGKWTEENLRNFIQNPQKFAPGSSMPNLGLHKKEAIEIVKKLIK